jgi:hypothetical protein
MGDGLQKVRGQLNSADLVRVRCSAVPDARASAVGTLELECSADGLQLVYLGLAAHQPGYAPGPPATGSVRIPWTGVRVSMAGDRQLLLELDPAPGPHGRLLLSRFRPGVALQPLEQSRRQRLLVASLLGFALLALLAAWSPRAEAWPRAAVALGAVAAVAAAVMRAGFARGAGSPPREPADDTFLELTEALSRHLPGFTPVATAPEPEPEPEAPFWSPARLEQLLPRTAVGMAISLAACGLATILTSIWLLRAPARSLAMTSSPEPPPTEAASPLPVAIAPPTTPVVSDVRAEIEPNAGLPLGAACECARPASILWDGGVPRLTTIVSGRRDGWEKNHPHLRFDLGVINNGNRALERLSLRVVFYEESRKKPSGRRVVAEQYLFDKGPLEPGRSLAWRVEGRGTSFEVLAPDLGKLDERGTQAAPAEAFDRLARDRQRAVRLHASMMLAFLGDERARQHALELKAEGRELEGPYLERVLQAISALRVCEVLASSEGTSHAIECCVQNMSKRPQSALGLRVRGVDGREDVQRPLTPPPLVFAESSFRIAGELAPRTGRTVELSFETSSTSPSPLLLEYVIESGPEAR